MMSQKIDEFLAQCVASLQSGDFVRLSLGAYQGADTSLKSIQIRKILIKKDEKLSFTFRHKTKDLIKNFSIEDGMSMIQQGLGADFQAATLFTTDYDLAFQQDRKSGRQALKRLSATSKKPADITHDRSKTRLIEAEGKVYLKELGVTDAKGQVLKSSQDKYRQINKFVEIISGLLGVLPGKEICRVVDMGSGKGYLTFALYDYLVSALDRDVRVTGFEMRPDMVDLCNRIAQESGLSGLSFLQGAIADADCKGVDLLIALHACDTATDDALAQGILNNVPVIVVAPCCHKQIRRELEASKEPEDLGFLLRYGTFMERQSEMVTDALRALILEAHGYAVKVFEFISDSHTPKNVMIVATRDGKARKQAVEKIAAAKKKFGISRHHLESLLPETGA